MKITNRYTTIRQMSSIELNKLPEGAVYQVECIGEAEYKIPVGNSLLTERVILKEYLVEYRVVEETK